MENNEHSENNDSSDESENNTELALDNPSDDESESHESHESVDEFKTWTESLQEEDIIDIENTVIELIDDYMQNEIHTMSSLHFHKNLKREITYILYELLYNIHFSEQTPRYRADMSTAMIEICQSEDLEEVEQLVGEICDNFFKTHIDVPPRSYSDTFTIPKSQEENDTITVTIDRLRNILQPKQRTEEWYKFRHNIITASNIWKVFGSECQYNSLVYEKCHPYTATANPPGHDYVNTSSPMHWGNKYEPLSVSIYEKMFQTKIEDFGCILHDTYPFIGASPDGINTDPSSSRYGRMLEIKNIVNREIDGIPKEEYWIQMQMQMETCQLDECDFLETRFKQYATEEEFYMGLSHSDSVRFTSLYEYHGVILYFVHKIIDFNIAVSSAPHYVYMPLDIPLQKETVDAWIKTQKDVLKSDYSLYEVHYWYLDELSCVLIKRNKEWFRNSVSKIEDTWKTIERERVEGYEHRSAKKRVPKPEVVHDGDSTSQFIRNLPTNNSICLIKLDE
jgi:putative phage-type endonuclease